MRQQGGEQQSTVGSNDKGGLTRNRMQGSHLSLTDPESIFLFAMVHLDLPAVRIGLQKFASRPV